METVAVKRKVSIRKSGLVDSVVPSMVPSDCVIIKLSLSVMLVKAVIFADGDFEVVLFKVLDPIGNVFIDRRVSRQLR